MGNKLYLIAFLFYIGANGFAHEIFFSNIETIDKPYYLDDFEEGTIVYKDSRWEKLRMNFNLKTGELEYIDEKNNTKKVEKEIQLFKVKNHFFCNINGFICEHIYGDDVQLFKSIHHIKSNYKIDEQLISSEFSFSSDELIYFVKIDQKFVKANAKSFELLFDRYSNYLDFYTTYLKLDYSNEADIIRLLKIYEYLSTKKPSNKLLKSSKYFIVS